MALQQNGSHVERVILDVLHESESTHMDELVQRVNRKETESVDEFEVRKAVWRLLDQHSVDLLPDLSLRKGQL